MFLTGLFSRSPKHPEKKKNVEMVKSVKTLVKEKKYAQALETGRKYLQKVPHNHDMLFIVGGIYYMQQKYKTAISYFEKALEIGSYDVEVLTLKANSHYFIGEIKNALQCCDRIVEIDPKNKSVLELREKIKS